MLHGQIEQQQLTGHNMRIKMITRLAGAEFTANPGDEIDVSNQQGNALIAGGFATLIKQDTIEIAVIAAPESAVTIKPKGKR